MKTWGLASANGYIAACITLHPGDMPEYVTPAQERATVVFSVLGLNDVDPNPERFSWEMDPAIENGNTKPQIVILDTTLEFECEGSYEPNEFGNKIIYAAAMATMLMWDTGRLRRLRFAQDALQRLERAVEMELKSEMDCIRELLSDDFHMEEGITKTKEATSSRNKEELFQLAAQRLLDICPFCAQIIPWESVTEAWCIAGHQFGTFYFFLLISS